MRSTLLSFAGAVLCCAATALPASAQQPHTPGGAAIPASLRAEHGEIHDALLRATKLPGRTGAAARALAQVLHPHFVREEQVALPPLGLLAALARGERTPQMQEILPLTDSLRAELPKMLREHAAIHAATMRMGEVARSERRKEVALLAGKLALHAQGEEEIFYPAALLVGDAVRAQGVTRPPD